MVSVVFCVMLMAITLKIQRKSEERKNVQFSHFDLIETIEKEGKSPNGHKDHK